MAVVLPHKGPAMIGSVRDLVKYHEGLRLVSYQDTGGVWTNGYGATGADVVPGLTWTQAQAEARLDSDLALATVRTVADIGLSTWMNLDEFRRAVLVDMAIEIGGAGLADFTRLISAFRAHDWPDAAEQLVDSKLYREVPSREAMNKQIIVTGQWPTL